MEMAAFYNFEFQEIKICLDEYIEQCMFFLRREYFPQLLNTVSYRNDLGGIWGV